jgi:hypothetical protein
MSMKTTPTAITFIGWVSAAAALTKPGFPLEIPMVYRPGTRPHVIMKLG